MDVTFNDKPRQLHIDKLWVNIQLTQGQLSSSTHTQDQLLHLGKKGRWYLEKMTSVGSKQKLLKEVEEGIMDAKGQHD